MTTRVVAVDPDQPDPTTLDKAAAIIRSGGLVAFGTETVYGLGADATNPEAVSRIFAAKGRPATNPLIVHVADLDGALECVAAWPLAAHQLTDHYWPGPLTLVLPRSNLIPDIVTAGQNSVGVRVPASLVARELSRRAGCPIAAPSANRSNRISPTTAAHVLKDLDGRVGLILDSGSCEVGIESTVLSLLGDRPTILRPGGVTSDEIAGTLKVSVALSIGSAQPDQATASPGQLAVHYAPRTPAYRMLRSDFNRLEFGNALNFGVLNLGEPPEKYPPSILDRMQRLADPITASARLYEMLHRFDELGLDFILIVTPAVEESGWDAILDRVRRATIPWTQAKTFSSTN